MNRLSFILVCAILLMASVSMYSQSKPKFEFPESNPFKFLLPVNFCEVVRKPGAYDGKIILMRVILQHTIEGATLYPFDSDDCYETMRPHLDCPNETACKKLYDRLFESYGRDRHNGRVGLVVKGRLRYRQFVTRTDIRLGRGHYDFAIIGIEELLKLPPNVEGNESSRP